MAQGLQAYGISSAWIKTWSYKSGVQEMLLNKKTVLMSALAVIFSLTSFTSANAAACRSNGWQPTFVHDLRFADGPWFVMPNGTFEKVRIRNRSWTAHVCNLIGRFGVRNRRGFTTCRAHTRIQCGCQRGLSERNSTCARFLRQHNRPFPILNY